MAQGSTDETEFSAEERAAMKERAKELRSAKKGKKSGLEDLLEKIAEMPEADRVLAERIHELVTEAAPHLETKTWYGFPAYALDGKVICFFQPAAKFKSPYATFGFNEARNLDNGEVWITAFGLSKLTPAAEKQIVELVKKAAGV
ncbi:iron chaperone [Salinibacterium soli]|uniref:DUF1801 domain-containing protein n=1 Tax=Antiquaquibacter soli TaxID=3064523 RepID=A0ABT9BP21_9MICO|nr:hypothetical protein [Protaetiibacter sp. WY-16]MDO7882142.1 hypothetical protein [Protaetiibacter sp. WY-16]